MVRWLNNFLGERYIKVLVDGEKSDVAEVTGVTPQGAILFPILFNIMMMDIPQDNYVKQFVFADDLTFCCVHKDPKMAQNMMQKYLSEFAIWADKWGMQINSAKSSIQHFSKKKMVCPTVKLGGSILKYQKYQKLLGIYLDSPRLLFG